MILVFVALPAVVAAFSLIELSGAMTRLARFGGDISYPLYILHYPTNEILHLLPQFSGLNTTLRVIIATVISMGFAVAALAVDERVRKRLKSAAFKVLRERPPNPTFIPFDFMIIRSSRGILHHPVLRCNVAPICHVEESRHLLLQRDFRRQGI